MLKESGEAAGEHAAPPGGDEGPAARELLPGRVGAWLGATLDLHETARHVLRIAVPHLADTAAVYVLEQVLAGGPGAGGVASRVAARCLASSMPPGAGHVGGAAAPSGDVVVFPAGTPHARCLAAGEPLVFSDDRGPRPLRVLALPLAARGEVTGLLLLGRWPGGRPFQAGDMSAAAELAAQAGLCVDNARLFSAERRIALALQHGLLPREPPAAPGLGIAHRYRPAKDHLVGGDWYDIVPLPGSRTAVLVGDAMGHGPEAATVMVQLRAAAHVLADLDLRPDALLGRLNRMAATLTQGTFATCVCAVLDPARQTGMIARAGHLPPLLALPGGPHQVIELPAGLPLGLGDASYRAAVIGVPPGSELVLYTDGLVESRTRAFDEGIQVLQAALAAATGPLAETCDAIVDELCQRSEDDTTLVLARIP